MWRFCFAALALLACLRPAAAQTILIDYDTTAAAPTIGGTWNSIPAPGSTPLLFSDGSASGVTVSFTGWTDGQDATQGPWPAGNIQWVDQNATIDYFVTASAAQITFSGLNTALRYRIDHVAARNITAFGSTAAYTIFGSPGDSSPNGSAFRAKLDGWDAGAILTWNSVAPNGSGQIVLSVAPVFLNFAYAKATRVQVVAVPEPTTILLFGGAIAGAGLVWRNRRQRQALALAEAANGATPVDD